MEPTRITITVPIRTVSTVNMREHWATKARRVRAERMAVANLWSYMTRAPWLTAGMLAGGERARVTLVRIAPRDLDDDNLRPSMKAIRDEIADRLGLRNDRDPRVAWMYEQRRGIPKQYAVEIHVEIEAGD